MKSLRVIDKAGNHTDYDSERVPRIGERVQLTYGRDKESVAPHYFRVKDVMYILDSTGDQAAILIEEETDPELWPS